MKEMQRSRERAVEGVGLPYSLSMLSSQHLHVFLNIKVFKL